MPKYKISEKDLTTQHGIAKLERDGFKRQDISRALYNLTPGVSQQERNQIMSKLYDRSEK